MKSFAEIAPWRKVYGRNRALNPPAFNPHFDWDGLLTSLEEAARKWQLPVLEAYKHHGPFVVLVGTLISLRTRDSVTQPALQRLLALASDAETLATTDPKAIAKAIYPAAFYRTKAAQLRNLSRILCEHWQGQPPRLLHQLCSLPGVGLKTANLTLSLGYGVPAICVDIHVHRIANRLGAVTSATPRETEALLRQAVPESRWSEINRLLVAFGQSCCQPLKPYCSRCPVSKHCARRGVRSSR